MKVRAHFPTLDLAQNAPPDTYKEPSDLPQRKKYLLPPIDHQSIIFVIRDTYTLLRTRLLPKAASFSYWTGIRESENEVGTESGTPHWQMPNIAELI